MSDEDRPITFTLLAWELRQLERAAQWGKDEGACDNSPAEVSGLDSALRKIDRICRYYQVPEAEMGSDGFPEPFKSGGA